VIRSSLLICVLSFVVFMGAIACSSNAPAPQNGGQGSGGLASDGGKPGSGGANAGGTAGVAQTGQGGSLAAGGRSGAGGSTTTGGSISTGGSTASGGRSSQSTGGSAGGTSSATGGASGTASGGVDGSAGSTGLGGAGLASGGRSGGDGGQDRTGGSPGSGGGSGGKSGGAGGQSNADASPSTGGTGGAYNPCKASPCKILPLGDSITHGYNSTDDAGYRSQLFKLIVTANQNVTFTGSQSNGPSTVSGKTFPKNHEGHDGYTVESGYSTYGTAGISSLIPSPAFDTLPDIVLLHIGTNDLTSSSSKTTIADRLDTELGRIVTAAPDALIVVAKVIPLGYTSSDWSSYNAKIPTIVQAHVAKGQHMVMVDMSALPTSQLNGVHPTDQGYAAMANIWYAAIKDVLPN
jgi:lysophospholipase L1-like esterase